VVVALGGNAISPRAGDASFAGERRVLAATAAELDALAGHGTRLLVVHGNGPQVGRLLSAEGGVESDLDIVVAQTQGELGYLLCEALDGAAHGTPSVAVLTRVLVDRDDPAFLTPTKPIGPVLSVPPTAGHAAPTPDGRGWRRVVASPRPRAVLELEAIRTLLATRHVVAGGGGGIALTGEEGPRAPCPAVIDKDWVAARLAIALEARTLVFVTDVPHVFADFTGGAPRRLPSLTVAAARGELARGVFPPGSMGPKIESAVEFVAATGRTAVIATPGAIAAACGGLAGTAIVP
jgi:carbamate kinase